VPPVTERSLRDDVKVPFFGLLGGADDPGLLIGTVVAVVAVPSS
jgi:hypothetical protein